VAEQIACHGFSRWCFRLRRESRGNSIVPCQAGDHELLVANFFGLTHQTAVGVDYRHVYLDLHAAERQNVSCGNGPADPRMIRVIPVAIA
jgi:hypothetical protein